MIPAGLVLADTSALARSAHPAVSEELARLGRASLLATCLTVDLEVLYSARSPAEYTRIAGLRDQALVDLPVTPEIGARARAIQAAMAAISQHRAAGVIDILTAVIAENYGATILHYDADFDHIARTTGQSTRWIVPAGSV